MLLTTWTETTAASTRNTAPSMITIHAAATASTVSMLGLRKTVNLATETACKRDRINVTNRYRGCF